SPRALDRVRKSKLLMAHPLRPRKQVRILAARPSWQVWRQGSPPSSPLLGSFKSRLRADLQAEPRDAAGRSAATVKGDLCMPHAPAPEEMNVYQNAEARFEVAAQKLGLEQGVYRYLKYPSKEITLYIPIGMDSGQLEVFTGYRVLHSTVRGPGKGGIRFAPDVSID